MTNEQEQPSTDLAIIGMAGRFPGARDVDEFWRNLVAGVESIRTLGEDELLAAGVPRHEFEQPDYVRACPVLDDIDKFDAAFFGISPRDASVMDPAHRLFLEVTWQALENSGNTGLPEEGRVGVWAASGAPLYWMKNVRGHRDVCQAMGEFLVRHTANDMNFLATRASYDLDLRGPSVNVQTACSSALVSLHMARQSLLAGECDMALIGGSTVVLPMGHGYHFKEGEILSPDGHCRPFDHNSAGTVFGSGAGVIVLKRLDDALDNGDTIVAVVKGSAINNDGSVKVGFLAPSVDGQVGVIRDALKSAGVPARSISYVEAHGTGTSVGDPIELTALEQAFAEQTQDKQFCGVGSVKSNIGHLGEAAAVAGLIKLALALQHRVLPATLGYEAPNPRFAMADSPFHVIAQRTEWRSDGPLRAGITALGAGGTNCHVILEEPPPPLPGEGGRERHLLVLSARTRSALDRQAHRLADHLERNPDVDLGDAAFTLAMGRRSLGCRRALSVRDRDDAIALLRGADLARVGSIVADTDDPGVVFTFPGGGAQYARMGFDLYRSEPAYREALDQCLQVIDAECGGEVRRLLFAEPGEVEAATVQLQRPSLALPALFAVEYSLARMFESFGLRPVALLGHSMGEYVAACLAGVFPLRDGLRLVHLRGKLFERTERGRMLSLTISEAEARELMPDGLSIAAVNAPELCVASGPSAQIERLGEILTERDIDWTPIHIDVAAHSSLLEPILAEFRAFCRTIPFRAPSIPIASNLTGRWLTPAEAQDPEYWVRHLRNTVRFADCVETVVEQGSHVFLEIGPGRTLTTLATMQRTKVAHAHNSVRHPREPADDVEVALLSLGKVWASGASCDWTALYDGQLRNRIPLPTYPFEGPSYWLDAKEAAAGHADDVEPHKREDLDEWFATVAWDLTPQVARPGDTPTRYLLLADDSETLDAVAGRLRPRLPDGSEVLCARHGERHARLPDGSFEVAAAKADHYRQLLEDLQNDGRAPEHVVLLIGASGDAAEAQTRAFLAPAHLAKAMAEVLDQGNLTLVTGNAFSVAGEPVDPFARLATGPALVVPREVPDIRTRWIDVDARRRAGEAGYDQLVRELVSRDDASLVALRAPKRFTPRIAPTALPAADGSMPWLRDGAVVLVTGGLGGMGRVLAQHLAGLRKLKLCLLSRDAMPERSEWSALLASGGTGARIRNRIECVTAIERAGSEALVVQGDVTDAASLARALDEVRARFGPVHVVVHAAGLLDDAPLQSKTEQQMQAVLAPKVLGTVQLDAALTEPLDAFVVMSSVASVLGLPGQIDYTAANAFLDAFAEARTRSKPGRTLSINWNAWRDVGMVLERGGRGLPAALPAGRCAHPWLDGWQPIERGRRYQSSFSVRRHWLLAEHRIEGADALIPGTGFVELARAAFDEAGLQALTVPDADAIELRQVTFLAPFQVGPDESRAMQIDVVHDGESCSVAVTSDGGADTHMTADVRACRDEAPRVDLDAVRARCEQQVATRDGFLDQDFVAFGPRWQNLAHVRRGDREAVLELALGAPFAADLPVLGFHPALLDMATGAAQWLIDGFDQQRDFLVPFGYDRIVIRGPVTARCTSHVRLRPESRPDVAAFDVRVYDENGNEVIAADGFTMKRIDPSAAIAQSGHVAASDPATEALLREAIAPAEGVLAFERALLQTESPQVIASSVDVNVWQRKLAREAQRLAGGDADDDGPSFSRPDLANEFEPPAGVVEEMLAAIWSKLLGVGDVGVLDNFFDLGGNSLIAVRFFARVKKDFGVQLPLSTLFQSPTIRQLAVDLQAEGYQPEQPAADAVEPATPPARNGTAHAPPSTNGNGHVPSTVLPPMPIRAGGDALPLFFVHDGLGEVLLYRSLALLLDTAHPVYGLEPEMVDGRVLHTTVAELARAKVERVRSVQPHGPYLLAGLCAGGVVAFEMARQLERLGEQVLFVGLIDAAAVGAEERSMRIARDRMNRVGALLQRPPGTGLLQHWTSVVPKLAGKARNLISYSIRSRLERRRTARTVAGMRADGTAPSAAAAGSELSFLKLYENAHREHRSDGKLRCEHVVLFRATEGNGEIGDVPFREVYVDDLLGWQRLCEHPVAAVDVPGGHSSALQEPHVGALARDLTARLRPVVVQHARRAGDRA